MEATLERAKTQKTLNVIKRYLAGLSPDKLAEAKIMFENEHARVLALPEEERQAEARRLLRVGLTSIQAGAIGMTAVVSIMVGIVVVGAALPVLWPMITASDTDIQAMNGTDDGTAFIQTFWPIIILIAGIGIAVMVIKSAMKKSKVG